MKFCDITIHYVFKRQIGIYLPLEVDTNRYVSYFPVNVGLLFSKNADTPSVRSLVLQHRDWHSISRTLASSKAISCP